MTAADRSPRCPAAEVAAALRAGRRVSTSRPAPEVFGATYADLAAAGYDAIVSVHLSAKISGTCAAAERAAPHGAGARSPWSTARTLAMAAGFAVLSGADGRARGRRRRRPSPRWSGGGPLASTTYFYVDNLEYLRRGGRIGTAAAVLGSALSVKPLLTVADGVIQAYERVRTESKALARLEELGLAALAQAAGQSDRVDVAVHHLDNLDGAPRLVDRLSGRVAGQ